MKRTYLIIIGLFGLLLPLLPQVVKREVAPEIDYNRTPKQYYIGQITVDGVKNYDERLLIGLSGLAEGEKIRASLYPKEARAKEMQSELDRLDELHQAKILSETEYEEAVRQLRKKYADADLKEKIENVQKYCESATTSRKRWA